ncbi:MAG: FKBP-type peptidyl-prolyl cis-trans isomerase [Balneolaceae bacterium]|nr:FKBP-type peptidyl-prolyl cis-trans isomerase [Balneolaceae bacterium]
MKFFKIALIPVFILLTGCLDSSSSSYDNTEDLAYYEDFSQQTNVTETSSGLLYRIIEEGEGGSPTADQHAIIKYTGNSVDQSSQYDTGNGFEIIVPNNMASFAGIGEGVQLMKRGARYEFVIPSDLAINDGRVFRFEIQLESFLEQDQEQFLVDNAELEDIQVTSSGLQYRVLEEGDGDTPTSTSSVSVHYKGTFTNGYTFDQSPEGEPVELRVSGVIDGFAEGLLLMKEGSKYELFLPPELGYGNNPPQFGTVLRFEVEIVEIL